MLNKIGLNIARDFDTHLYFVIWNNVVMGDIMKPDIIFEQVPSRWGLRGDPHLWNELKEKVQQQPGFDTAEDFLLYLNTTIENIIGKPLLEGQYPYVERFNSGGMSGGRIDAGFWLNTILPLLQFRFHDLSKNAQ